MGGITSRVTKPIRNLNVENRAQKLVDNIEKGKVVRAAPLHATEQKRVHAAETDERLKEVNKKHPDLIERVNKIQINVTGVETSERKEGKLYPTKQTEAHYPATGWEYRFFEPPQEKIPNCKLTFREALTLMSADVRLKHNPMDSDSENILKSHPATQRVPNESIKLMLKYFGPFEFVGGMTLLAKNQILNYQMLLLEQELFELNAKKMGLDEEGRKKYLELRPIERIRRIEAILLDECKAAKHEKHDVKAVAALEKRLERLQQIEDEVKQIMNKEKEEEQERKQRIENAERLIDDEKRKKIDV